MSHFATIHRTKHGWNITGGEHAREVFGKLIAAVAVLERGTQNPFKYCGLRQPQRMEDLAPKLRDIVHVYLRGAQADADRNKFSRDCKEILNAYCDLAEVAFIGVSEVRLDPTHPDHAKTVTVCMADLHEYYVLMYGQEKADALRRDRVNCQRREIELHLLHTVNHTVAELHARRALFAQDSLETVDGRDWTLHNWINVRAKLGGDSQYDATRGRGNAARRRIYDNPSTAELRRADRRYRCQQRLVYAQRDRLALAQAQVEQAAQNLRHLEEWFASIRMAED